MWPRFCTVARLGAPVAAKSSKRFPPRSNSTWPRCISWNRRRAMAGAAGSRAISPRIPGCEACATSSSPVIRWKESPKQGEDVAKLIKRSDVNEDGKVTADEWNATRVASFKKRDANGDNILERAEYVAYESRGD